MPLFAILTLFPEALEPYLRAGIVGIAREKGLIRVLLVDFRDFSRDRHRSVDDRPYGGGPGMVLRPEPIVDCVEWLEARHGPFRKLLLCPGGRVFRQELAVEFAREERVLLICGRYEGVDARVSELLELEPLSIGDYVLSGGELPALVVTEAVTRLLPGSLGDERSAVEESFRGEPGAPPLDHPHYTRPPSYRGRSVPQVLMSGDHAAIARWRAREARKRTERWRPDLLASEMSGATGERQHESLPVKPARGAETSKLARGAGDRSRSASPRQPEPGGAHDEHPEER